MTFSGEKTMKEKKLPKTVYVWWQYPMTGDPFLECSADWRGNPDGLQVGVYELKFVGRIQVDEKLV